VHEHVIAILTLTVEHHVVPGSRRLKGDVLHDAAAWREHRRALGGGQILALVDVSGSPGAEAAARSAPGERTEEGEAVGVEAEARDAGGARGAPQGAPTAVASG